MRVRKAVKYSYECHHFDVFVYLVVCFLLLSLCYSLHFNDAHKAVIRNEGNTSKKTVWGQL